MQLLHCPNCKSADLKRVSLAYKEGLYRVNTRTRVTGFLIGSGGPDIFMESAKTRGFHQTEMSTLLTPPRKWSYGKLLLWAGFFSLLALVAFVVHVNSTPPPVSSLPAQLYVIFAPILLVFLLFVFWRHNRVTYRTQYLRWDRSFICERCGAVSLQDISNSSPLQT
jgi:hypothetical protein